MLKILDVEFSEEDSTSLALRIATTKPKKDIGSFVFTANLDHARLLSKNALFSEAYKIAHIVTVDGAPISYLLRLKRGRNLPRVPGADLFPVIIEHLDPANARPLFVCGSNLTANGLIERLVKGGFSPEAVSTCVPPFGFENDARFAQSLIGSIKEYRITHLFMGLGAPKSEIWCATYAHDLSGVWCCCFGAGLDFYAQTKRRSPGIFQKTGSEWLWRLITEPRRLASRYFKDAIHLVRVIFDAD